MSLKKNSKQFPEAQPQILNPKSRHGPENRECWDKSISVCLLPGTEQHTLKYMKKKKPEKEAWQ